ncbi:hypothetical protein CNMCM8980_008186 [Aspergillus fumigatiaffinis]|nr:hypothetical protein CNMCM8980_008186 [Aspergillus fumigatiaffinis]
MLGVMKAGGAFVLLDPAHPAARLQGICQTVSASIVVASATQAPTAEPWAARVVAVGTDEVTWRSTNDACKSSVTPNTALYAVFTSGSTGSPKGAVIPHASFSTGALTHGNHLSLTHQSRVLQFASYGFDVSISDHLTTLIFGGCVCVSSEEALRNDLVKCMSTHKVNWAHITPSVVRSLQPREVPGLELLALIGEPMSQMDVYTWARQVRLVNSYGPAECSVVSSTYRAEHAQSEARIVGRGLGCVCWIVDPQEHGTLLPIGALGELLIEGPIVGRGYLNDPEKTAAAFVDPPAWLRTFRAAHPGNPGGDRVYKTGDLVQ